MKTFAQFFTITGVVKKDSEVDIRLHYELYTFYRFYFEFLLFINKIPTKICKTRTQNKKIIIKIVAHKHIHTRIYIFVTAL